MKLLQTLALLIAFSSNAFAVTVIKESRTDEDIKFVTSPSGVSTEQGQVDGATGRLGFDEYTNAAGVGAPNFPFGATGISASILDFTIQSIVTPTLTLNGGVLRRGTIEVATYDGTGATSGDFGTDITANLDTVLGSTPANATAYYLYIDLSGLQETITTDNNRALYGVTESNLFLSTDKPDVVGGGLIFLGAITSATTGNAWSGAGASFVSASTKSYERPNVNVSPTVYQLEKQNIGSVGAVDNAQGALEDSFFPNTTTLHYYHLDGDSLDDSSNSVDLTTNGSPSSDLDGFFGRSNLFNLEGAGSSDSFTASNSDFSITTGTEAFSIGAWFRSPDWDENVDSMFFNVGGGGGSNISLKRDGLGRWSLAGPGLGFSPIPDIVFEDNTWHHVAWTVDVSNNFLIYVDGKLFHTDATTNGTFLDGDIGLGIRLSDSANLWKGSIQDFFTHKGTALTEAQINGIYSRRFSGQQIKAGHVLTSDSFNSGIPDTKLSFWNLNDVNDDSTNSRALTNEGSMTFAGGDILGGNTAAVFNGTAAGTLSYTADDFFNKGRADFTMGAWVSHDWTTTQSFFSLSPSGGDRVLEFNIIGNGFIIRPVFTTLSTTDILEFSPSDLPIPNSWHHIVLKYDSIPNTMTLYWDGVFAKSLTLGDDLKVGGSNEFNLGTRRNQLDLFFVGKMQEFFWSQTVMSDDEIRKKYSAKLTHNKGVSVDGQQWYGNFSKGDNSTLNNELDQDWLLDKTSSSVFIDTGLRPEDSLSLRLQNQSFSVTSVPIQTYSSGLLTSDPGSGGAFTLPHGLACTPKDFFVRTLGQTTAGDWDKRYDLLSVDSADISGNVSSLLIDASHPLEIIASCAPVAAVVDLPNELLITNDTTSQNITVQSGSTLFRPNLEILTGATVEVNGTYNTVGEITGAGSLIGTGSVKAVDAGQNGDKAVFDDVEINGDLSPAFIWEINFLSSDITSNDTDVASLRFDNLTVGETYRLTMQIGSSSSGEVVLLAKHDGSTLLRCSNDPSSGTSIIDASSNRIFVATTTSLTFDAFVTSGTLISTLPRTFTQIESLPFHKQGNL